MRQCDGGQCDGSQCDGATEGKILADVGWLIDRNNNDQREKVKVMSNLVLQAKTDDYQPHPEGIYAAVCVDVMDLGLVESEYQGQRRMVNKVRLYFETEYRSQDGKCGIVSKTFTASLHAKAKLADFLGKWRGRAVVPGETIELSKLLGVCCTLVISQQENLVGRKYSSIDAVSKPTKRIAASGQYNPQEARQRYEERKAKASGANPHGAPGRQDPNWANGAGASVRSAFVPRGGASARQAGGTVDGAPVRQEQPDYDPDVGF